MRRQFSIIIFLILLVVYPFEVLSQHDTSENGGIWMFSKLGFWVFILGIILVIILLGWWYLKSRKDTESTEFRHHQIPQPKSYTYPDKPAPVRSEGGIHSGRTEPSKLQNFDNIQLKELVKEAFNEIVRGMKESKNTIEGSTLIQQEGLSNSQIEKISSEITKLKEELVNTNNLLFALLEVDLRQSEILKEKQNILGRFRKPIQQAPVDIRKLLKPFNIQNLISWWDSNGNNTSFASCAQSLKETFGSNIIVGVLKFKLEEGKEDDWRLIAIKENNVLNFYYVLPRRLHPFIDSLKDWFDTTAYPSSSLMVDFPRTAQINSLKTPAKVRNISDQYPFEKGTVGLIW